MTAVLPLQGLTGSKCRVKKNAIQSKHSQTDSDNYLQLVIVCYTFHPLPGTGTF